MDLYGPVLRRFSPSSLTGHLSVEPGAGHDPVFEHMADACSGRGEDIYLRSLVLAHSQPLSSTHLVVSNEFPTIPLTR